MTIAIPIIGTPDDIDTFDGLVEGIMSYLKDTALEDQAPRFIYLAERRFNRVLHNLEGEGTSTATAAAALPLPSDFKMIRSVYLDTDPRQPLTYMSPESLRTYWDSQTTGRPLNYSLVADQLLLGPAPDSDYTVTMTYSRSLTPLTTSNQTNWLIEAHADLYFYSALAHAEFYGWNDDRLPMIKAFVDETIQEINQLGLMRRSGSGMRMRASSVA